MNKNFAHTKDKLFFLMFLISLLLVSIATPGAVLTDSKLTHSTKKVCESASPSTTYFYVDPLEVRDIAPTGQFSITINVTQAPEAYGWEIILNWNSTLLEWFYKKEGDFLSRGTYTTYFSTSQLAEANLNGEIVAGCTLVGDVPLAGGNGWLCSLGFKVKTYGSSVLNLSGTRLWGEPQYQNDYTYTYFPGQDGFFYNQQYHDIAATNVTVQPTIVEPSGSASINVTIENEGNFTETSGTFNVIVYADKTVYEYVYGPPFFNASRIVDTKVVVGDEITVGTQTGVTLDVGANTTLTFTWDVTGIEGGNYTISAEAMGDDDTRDNLFIDDIVTVTATPVHDIAITNVVPTSNEVTVGENVTINVTVKNEGTFDQTFNVTLYYDGNAIATQTSITLTSGSNTTLTFTWVTAGVSEGTYSIKAEASVVEGETNTANNTFTNGTVKVQGAQAPNILPYVVAIIVIITVVVIAIYFIVLRKRVRR